MLLRDYPRTDFNLLTVDGLQASTTLRAKVNGSPLPTVPTAAGTTEVSIRIPFAGTITAIAFVTKDGLVANSDTNFATFSVVNKGQSGVGATAVLAATAPNTTKLTGGTAITGYQSRSLVLSATPANLVVAAGDVLACQVVGSGTLANTLTEGYYQVIVDTVT